VQLFKLKARVQYARAVNMPASTVITEAEALRKIKAKRQAAVPKRSRRTRARVGRREVF
jgi:hypothetical protein